MGTNNLMVTVLGSGTGTVSSTPTGISCPSSCLAAFSQNSNVTLTATAAEGSTFAGFSSNCVPANPQTNPPTCVVPIGTADVTVTATFNTGTGVTLTVTEAGTGTGTVSSAPAGISCPTTCSANFASGTSVTLTAAAARVRRLRVGRIGLHGYRDLRGYCDCGDSGDGYIQLQHK